jgi:hypothetical protein
VKYTVAGKGSVSLSEDDFKTAGGEGRIFLKGDLAYKIYFDYKKMIPEKKIDELESIKKENILVPLDILLDSQDRPIGFTMQFINNTQPMVKLLSNAYKKRKKFTPTQTLKLIQNIQRETVFIHERNCLVVDFTEMNLLFKEGEFTIPYFIDTNCYRTPSFPETAITLAIKDWSVNGYTEMTDWYSVGILAFKLIVGIHPFMGTHKNFASDDVVGRMKAGISVYHPDVTLNKRISLDVVPDDYRKWFKTLFVDNKRVLPPNLAGIQPVVVAKAMVVQSTDKLEIKLKRTYSDDVIDYYRLNRKDVAITEKEIIVSSESLDTIYKSMGYETIVFTPQTNKPIAATLNFPGYKGRLAITHLETHEFLLGSSKSNAEGLMRVDNTLYMLNAGQLMEMGFTEFGNKVIVQVVNKWKILPHASEMFDGVVYQNTLGKCYFYIPYKRGSSAKGSCAVVKMEELDGYRIMNARRSSNVLMVLLYKDNKYERAIIKFKGTFESYVCDIYHSNEYDTINFDVLYNGIVVTLTDGKVMAMNSNPDKPGMKIIPDNDVTMDMELRAFKNEVEFFKDSYIYTMTMRK